MKIKVWLSIFLNDDIYYVDDIDGVLYEIHWGWQIYELLINIYELSQNSKTGRGVEEQEELVSDHQESVSNQSQYWQVNDL